MGQGRKTRRVYHSAGYLTSTPVYFGTLLFLSSRLLRLIQLFVEAANRKKLHQAMPEDFTVWGVVGYVLLIGVILMAFLLLQRVRRGQIRMKKGLLYLLLNLLFMLWGVVYLVDCIREMIPIVEITYVLGLVAAVCALIVPSVLLQLADSRRDFPRDTALLLASIAAVGLSIVETLIIALVYRKSYPTALPLISDLLYRAAMILFGLAGLITALRLRAQIPPVTVEKREPETAERVECPDCGKRVPISMDECPRCGYPLHAPDLFGQDDAAYAYDDEPVYAPPARTAYEPPRDTRALCPSCGKRIPKGLATCPHCGYYPDDEADGEEPSGEPPERNARTAYEPPRDTRAVCPSCGKRIPKGLATCPHCGYYPDDEADEEEHLDEPPPYQQPAYRPPKRVSPNTRRVARVQGASREDGGANRREKILCPQCGRRFSAANDTCPYCGYDLYDE